MVFWRKKKNIGEQEREEREDRLLHYENEPEIELPPELEEEQIEEIEAELHEPEKESIDELKIIPVPVHTPLSDAQGYEEEKEHREEEASGGWLSRLTEGLSR